MPLRPEIGTEVAHIILTGGGGAFVLPYQTPGEGFCAGGGLLSEGALVRRLLSGGLCPFPLENREA